MHLPQKDAALFVQRITKPLAPTEYSGHGRFIENNKAAKVLESACSPARAVENCLGSPGAEIIAKVAKR